MHRSMIFLVFAFLIGLVLIFARMKGHESQYGGIGRYQGRGDNAAAWQPYQGYHSPSPRDLLKIVCSERCPDSSFLHKLLPEDNFRYFLLTFRDKDAEHVEDPVRQFEDVFYQENDLPIRGRLSDSSSLKDLLLILNELNQKAAAEKHAQQEPPPPDSNTQESGSQDSGMSPH